MLVVIVMVPVTATPTVPPTSYTPDTVLEQRRIAYQLCDIHDPKIQALLSEAGSRPEFDVCRCLFSLHPFAQRHHHHRPNLAGYQTA